MGQTGSAACSQCAHTRCRERRRLVAGNSSLECPTVKHTALHFHLEGCNKRRDTRGNHCVGECEPIKTKIMADGVEGRGNGTLLTFLTMRGRRDGEWRRRTGRRGGGRRG